MNSRLGVWSEMFSDGILSLDAAGALDPDRPVVASFAFGSPELYRWLDGNERVVMRRTEVTNDPAQIARQPDMTSVNTALQIDLFGQANASRIAALETLFKTAFQAACYHRAICCATVAKPWSRLLSMAA